MLCTGLTKEMLGFDRDHPDAKKRRIARHLDRLLFQASVMMVDELIDDVCWAAEMDHEDRFDAAALPWVSTVIQPRFLHRVTYGFTRNLLIAGADLSSQLSRGWMGPGCVMQSLLVDHLLNEVEALADMKDLKLGAHWRDGLEDALLPDTDHHAIYNLKDDGIDASPTGSMLGMHSLGFDDWFEPYGHAALPTFLLDR